MELCNLIYVDQKKYDRFEVDVGGRIDYDSHMKFILIEVGEIKNNLNSKKYSKPIIQISKPIFIISHFLEKACKNVKFNYKGKIFYGGAYKKENIKEFTDNEITFSYIKVN